MSLRATSLCLRVYISVPPLDAAMYIRLSLLSRQCVSEIPDIMAKLLPSCVLCVLLSLFLLLLLFSRGIVAFFLKKVCFIHFYRINKTCNVQLTFIQGVKENHINSLGGAFYPNEISTVWWIIFSGIYKQQKLSFKGKRL